MRSIPRTTLDQPRHPAARPGVGQATRATTLADDEVDLALANEAVAAGLLARRDVVDRLARARAAVLRQALVDSVRLQLAPPGAREIAEHFHAHPAIYGQRKRLRLLRVTVANHALQQADTVAALAACPSLSAWPAVLQAQGVAYQVHTRSYTGDQLPDALLRPLHGAEPGRRFRLPEGERLTTVWEVLAVDSAPRTLDEASAEIAALLQARQLAQRVEALLLHHQQAQAAQAAWPAPGRHSPLGALAAPINPAGVGAPAGAPA